MSFLVLLQISTLLIFVWVISKLLASPSPPTYGHYTRKTGFYFVKKWILYLYLKLFVKRESLLACWNPKEDSSIAGYGIIATKEEEELDFRNDSVEICAANAEEDYLIAGVDENDDSEWMYLRFKYQNEVKELQLPLPCKSLKLQPIEPLRKWKLSFNGFLKNATDVDENAEVTSGKLRFLWTPIFQEVINSKDHRNEWLIAKAVAKEKWTADFYKKINEHVPSDWHEQWGVLEGRIQLEGIKDEIPLVLKGKKRRTKSVKLSNAVHKIVGIDIYFQDAKAFHLRSESFKSGLTQNSYGYVIFCDGKYEELEDCNFGFVYFAENSVPNEFSFQLKTGQRSYHVLLKLSNPNFSTFEGVKRDRKTVFYLVTATSDGIKGYGFLRITRPCQPSTISLPKLLLETKAVDKKLLVVPLNDANCRDGDFVGGKAVSLALMTMIKSTEFSVSKGVCLTVAAYKRHLNENAHLLQLIKELRTVCARNDLAVIQSYCQNVVDKISHSKLSSSVKEAVKRALNNVFGQLSDDKRFAIRSSAVGEDGEDASSAGQNETFLGISGFAKICEAILKCWASQFAFQAVRYRWQHGQPIDCEMGVVIQEMINSQVAGVFFTREPVNGSVSKMLITANYGLGESVVSAACDPDTIYITRTWNNDLSIKEKHLGEKQLVITLDETCGTKTVPSTDNQKTTCCLDDRQIMQLARVGILFENAFGSPRDIEWAFSDGNLYILQSRAITNLDLDDDWWIAHEFNSAPMADNEVFSTANVGEVIPGAVSPLSISLGFSLFDVALREFNGLPAKLTKCYNLFYFGFAGWHVMLSVTNLIGGNVSRKLTIQDIAIGHSLFGGDIYSGGLHEASLHRYGESNIISKLRSLIPAMKQIIFNPKKLYIDTSEEALCQLKKNLAFSNTDDASSILFTIEKDISAFYKIMYNHLEASNASSIFYGIMIAILAADQKEFKSEHLEDVADLMGNCSNVVSADVPAAIEKLIAIVAELPVETKEYLKTRSCEEVLKWFQSDKGKAGSAFKNFLDTHGHRGYRELEFRTMSWAENPTALINSIKASLNLSAGKRIEKNPLQKNEKDVIGHLNTSLPFLSKMIMRFILNKSKNGVIFREYMKSYLVHAFATLRKAYRELGKRMVEEGRIPDEDLVFYFTHYELRNLLKSRSSKLITKAIQRKAIHPRLEKLQFGQMIYEHPKIKLDDEDAEDELIIERESNLFLEATCASRGKCRGTARVVKGIENANAIQPGDILITHATDICWSPYFPLLSGIVTENGGLVSHGAVVAREYGLPCLIAAENATKLFRSGDTVLLDASKGIIKLITENE